MMHRSLRLVVRLGLFAGLLLVLAKLVQSRRSSSDDAWGPAEPASWPPVQPDPVTVEEPASVVPDNIPPLYRAGTPAKARPVKKATKAVAKKASAAKASSPAPAPPVPVRRVRETARRPWVEPLGRDTPTSHPVKAKLSSMLYHLPGMAFYDRTNPDRCYADAEAAEADGFIRAKR